MNLRLESLRNSTSRPHFTRRDRIPIAAAGMDTRTRELDMPASRRQFLAGAGLAAAGATVAAPSLAQPSPDVHWQMTSAFQPGLDLIFGAAQTFARALSDMTDGRFTVTIHPPGEIAPAVDALDAVADGKAECAHTSLGYSWNKEPAYAFGSGAPFGMNARQQAAWLQDGGGGALIDEVLADRKLMAAPLGDTGGQMAGWFRKEVHGVSDFSGMKVRIGGFAGKVLEALGASIISVPKDGILEALSKGSLDAFEWVGPYDDERFSGAVDGAAAPISKVAPYYYYPGWWKGEMQLHLIVAKEKFAALPKSYQGSLLAAAALGNGSVRAKYDAANPGALKRLVIGGAQLKLFPQEILEACYKSANDLYAQLSQENPRFKKIADSYMAFRADEYLWWQVAEYSFDNFMIRERRAKG
jgi:TRAP-type mannitol/chloroaromatic compound transport system substrate-binding protein